jgi:hypothetical protein
LSIVDSRPAGAVLTVAAILYALFWLSLPVVILAVGIDQLRAAAPAVRLWPALWTVMVVTGIALDALGLWALGTTNSGGGFQRTWLAATVGPVTGVSAP